VSDFQSLASRASENIPLFSLDILESTSYSFPQAPTKYFYTSDHIHIQKRKLQNGEKTISRMQPPSFLTKNSPSNSESEVLSAQQRGCKQFTPSPNTISTRLHLPIPNIPSTTYIPTIPLQPKYTHHHYHHRNALLLHQHGAANRPGQRNLGGSHVPLRLGGSYHNSI
jgi:hypothetical protein